MRHEIQSALSLFVDSLPEEGPLGMIPEDFHDALTDLSDFTATARSHVPRDRNHHLQYQPKPEVATRLGKELAKLFLSLADVRGKAEPNYLDFRTVIRVAEDCLPPNRRAILDCLRNATGPITTEKIVETAGLPDSTTKQTLEDLSVLELVCSELGPSRGSVAQKGWSLDPVWADKLLCAYTIADLLAA
jgi:hypothetical protein